MQHISNHSNILSISFIYVYTVDTYWIASVMQYENYNGKSGLFPQIMEYVEAMYEMIKHI